MLISLQKDAIRFSYYNPQSLRKHKQEFGNLIQNKRSKGFILPLIPIPWAGNIWEIPYRIPIWDKPKNQVLDPTAKISSRLWICSKRKWRAKWIGSGTFREMFRFKCKHIPFVLHSHCLSVRIWVVSILSTYLWHMGEAFTHAGVQSGAPFSGPGFGMGVWCSRRTQTGCAWQLNNLWCRRCHRLYL